MPTLCQKHRLEFDARDCATRLESQDCHRRVFECSRFQPGLYERLSDMVAIQAVIFLPQWRLLRSYSSPVRHGPHNASRTNHLHKLRQELATNVSNHNPMQTHLLMPAQQHTHSLSTTLRTTKTPASDLCETPLLRRKTLACRSSSSRLALAHALVEVLHKSVADFRTTLGLVDALQDGRHFRLPY
jgi:hypothetical protein